MNNQLSDLAQKYGGSYDPGSGTITINPNYTDSTNGMLNFHEAYNLGLASNTSGNYPESIGTTEWGSDGNVYVLKVYTGTGRAHWYRQGWS